MPSVFISYSQKDQHRAMWLAKYLKKSGVTIWLDEADLEVGDPLIERIAKAIEHADFVVAIISNNSICSVWVKKELSLAMTKEIKGKKIVVLPIKIDDCELPAFLFDKYYANLTSLQNFESKLKKIVQKIGASPPAWPDLNRMYCSKDWQTILMVQTFADRREWGGPSYHCVNPRRRLKRVLKVFGGYKHPIQEPIATQFINNSINNILDLDPDILGLGGMGRTANRIRSGLQEAGYEGKIDYWGGDAGIDACEILKRYGVESAE